MKLLFLGDIACPEKDDINKLKKLKETGFFKDKIVIGNLEGLLVNEEKTLEKYNNALFNDIDILEVFNDTKRTIFSLANNHMKDIPENFEYTIETLKKNKIAYVGASNEKVECYKPYTFVENGKKFAIFAHCWNVMTNIINNKSKDIYINDLNYEKLIKQVREYKQKQPEDYVIIYFHWNFDFEKLPFPAHRVIANKLIEAGCNIVIGGHSHLVNGVEKIKNGVAVYGFGNFYIPNNKFLDGKLAYPKESNLTLSLEIDTDKENKKCYWLENSERDIKVVSEEEIETGKLISKYSPFRKFNEKEYKKFFKNNRTKRMLVPIWYNEKNNFINILKDKIVVIRMKGIRHLKKIK